MRTCFIFLLFIPFAATAQLPGRQDDSLRKIADTLRFPSPFRFTKTETTQLKTGVTYKACNSWLQGVKDSLPGLVLAANKKTNTVVAKNVPATADISYTIVVLIKNNRYTISLQDYLYHSINGKILPVEQAAVIKEYKDACNIERVLIVRNYPAVFTSLRQFLDRYKP